MFTFTLTGDDLHLDEAYFTVRKKKDTEILFQSNAGNHEILDDTYIWVAVIGRG